MHEIVLLMASAALTPHADSQPWGVCCDTGMAHPCEPAGNLRERGIKLVSNINGGCTFAFRWAAYASAAAALAVSIHKAQFSHA